jgi:O-antigen ligase
MDAATLVRDTWAAGMRRLGDIPLRYVLAVAVGALALAGGWAAILRLQSIKYLGGMIFVCAAGVVFLAIRRKHAFLVYCLGFTMPYFVELILLERDRGLLAVTGTFLVTTALAVVGLATGAIDIRSLRFEPRVTVPMLLVVGSGLLSMINTTDRTLSLIAIAQELEMVFIFLVMINAIRDEEHLVIFLRGLYMGFAIQCVIYVIQNIVGFSFDVLGNRKWAGVTDVESGRIGSHRGTFAAAPATAALYFSLMTLGLTGIFLSRRRLRIGIPVLVGIVMGVGCLILGAKRAPMSGFALAILAMCILLPRHSPGALKRLVPLLATFAFPLLLFLPVFLLRAHANHVAAFESRMNLTRVVWEMHDAHPVVGVGVGTYDSVKRDYLPDDWRGWLYIVHQRYLLILAETGWAGLGAFVLWLLMLLHVAYRGIARIAIAHRPLQIALLACLLAICWEMFWDVFNGRQHGYITVFVAALAVIVPRVLAEPRAPEPA